MSAAHSAKQFMIWIKSGPVMCSSVPWEDPGGLGGQVGVLCTRSGLPSPGKEG